MTKIAIVTVSYNAEKDIEQTIKSVLIQDSSNLSYYIMDGQSTDNTMKILMQYKPLFSNIEKKYLVTCKKDDGIFDAMNSSLESISEDYVLFLNAGDYLADEHVISHVENYLNQNECDICYGDFYRYNGNKRKKVVSGEPFELPRRMITTHQAIFTKTELLKRHLYETRYKMAADYNFYLNMFLLGKTFLHYHKVIVYFQVGGISQKNAKLTQKEVVDIKKMALNLGRNNIRKLQMKVPFICFKKRVIACLPNFVRYHKYEVFK